MIGFGVKAKDRISGFTGVVTARAQYISGCDQYSLTPEAKNNEFKDPQWFDENRIEILDENPEHSINTEAVQGGPQHSPSKG